VARELSHTAYKKYWIKRITSRKIFRIKLVINVCNSHIIIGVDLIGAQAQVMNIVLYCKSLRNHSDNSEISQ